MARAAVGDQVFIHRRAILVTFFGHNSRQGIRLPWNPSVRLFTLNCVHQAQDNVFEEKTVRTFQNQKAYGLVQL